MIAAYDIGNTSVKVYLCDENFTVVAKKNRPTPDLFEPDAWRLFFEELEVSHESFKTARKMISCVNWRVFLALRVVFGYTPEESFYPEMSFDESLMKDLPEDSPFIFEHMIPLNRSTEGLIGTDRLLAAYALFKLHQESYILASLGTATTVDLITKDGMFFSGVVMPGLDSAYSGLLSRAVHLPPLTQLPIPQKVVNTQLDESLAAGCFIGHAVMLEGFFTRIRRDAALQGPVAFALTGGRAYTISPFIKIPHVVKEDLTLQGLVFMATDVRIPKELEGIGAFLSSARDEEYNAPDSEYKVITEEEHVDDIVDESIQQEACFRTHIEEEEFLNEETTE